MRRASGAGHLAGGRKRAGQIDRKALSHVATGEHLVEFKTNHTSLTIAQHSLASYRDFGRGYEAPSDGDLINCCVGRDRSQIPWPLDVSRELA